MIVIFYYVLNLSFLILWTTDTKNCRKKFMVVGWWLEWPYLSPHNLNETVIKKDRLENPVKLSLQCGKASCNEDTRCDEKNRCIAFTIAIGNLWRICPNSSTQK